MSSIDIERFADMSGDNSFCHNCPDHEACMQGYPCYHVVLINFEYEERKANEGSIPDGSRNLG